MDFDKDLSELKDKITPLNIAKFITGAIVSLGAYTAVSVLFKGSLKNVKGLNRLIMKAGIFMLGCKAGDVADKYLCETIDETVESVKELKKEFVKNESVR